MRVVFDTNTVISAFEIITPADYLTLPGHKYTP